MTPEEHKIALVFPVTDPGIGKVTLPVRLHHFYGAYRAIHQGGVEESAALVLFGNRLLNLLAASGIPEHQLVHEFRTCWRWLGDHYGAGVNRWDSKSDLVFSFVYFLLREKVITREEAARFAVLELGEPLDQPNLQENFRKRLARWAKPKALPEIGHPIRKTRTRH